MSEESGGVSLPWLWGRGWVEQGVRSKREKSIAFGAFGCALRLVVLLFEGNCFQFCTIYSSNEEMLQLQATVSF